VTGRTLSPTAERDDEFIAPPPEYGAEWPLGRLSRAIIDRFAGALALTR
jgi:hypothetical protein